MISVQQQDFDIGVELSRLRREAGNVGAVVSFTGLVRELHDLGVGSGQASSQQELFLEHYPGMTEKALEEIAREACGRWDIQAWRIIHRVGPLKPGDQIVLVITASPHRQEAFAAAEFIMDYLKTRAPFWKRETGPEGSRWVSHRHSDEVAARRWDSSQVNA